MEVRAVTGSEVQSANGPAVVARGVAAVSWSAIIAGVAASVATTLVLLTLVAGLGLAAVSPWPGRGISMATTFTATAVVALVVVQWLSAALGGYLTGRLRTRWVSTHTHEVFFRDTAHGFLTWCVATLLMAGAASLLVAGALRPGATGGATLAADAAPTGPAGAFDAYDLDTLLRSNGAAGAAPAVEARAQAERILAREAIRGSVPDVDRAYLVRIVAQHTGLAEAEAARRVDATVAEVRQNADAARKGAALSSICTVLSMLVGAFIASVAAALGGRQRDLHP